LDFGPDNTLDFDGINDYVHVTNDSSLKPTDAVTYEAWVRVDDFDLDEYGGIIDNSYMTNPVNNGFCLVAARSGNRFRGRVGTTNGNQILYSTQSEQEGVWYHTAVTYDRSAELVRLYVNGYLEDWAALTGPIDWTNVTDSSYGLNIGRYIEDDEDFRFQGRIDEVRIWNIARSQNEIRDNMDKNLWGTQTGLVAYYRFNRISGAVLPDISGNGHVGTLNNMTDNDWVVSYAVIGGETVQSEDNVRGYWNGATDTSWNNSSGLWMNGASFGSESDFIVFGHDSFSGTTDADLPVGVKLRLGRIWYLDERGNVSPDINFNLEWAEGMGLGRIAPSCYVLLNRPGASGAFFEGTAASSRIGWEVTVPGVSLLDAYYYTLGTYLTPTPSVTPTSTATPSPSPSVTPTPSATPTPSVPQTPSTTPTSLPPSVTPTPNITPTPGCCCYVVAQQGGAGGCNLLTRVNPADPDPRTNEVNIGDSTGTGGIEAIAYEEATGILYAVNYNRLGVLDLSSGKFIPAPHPIGSGEGKLGRIEFKTVGKGDLANDVDGLAFQPVTGTLFGTVRRNGDDLLIQIDTSTGQLIPGVFHGKDYLVIESLAPGLDDIDDIAFEPVGGALYAVQNNRGRWCYLVIIDLEDGSVTEVAPLSYNGASLNDVEGLNFGCSGQLWGLTGNKIDPAEGDRLWEINRFTAVADNPIGIDNGSDYEGVACGYFAPAPTPVRPLIASGDYNGDGRSDIAIFRRSSGLWAVRGVTRAYFGNAFDNPAPGDYDGDGTTDIGIFRPGTGLWAVMGGTRVYFGNASDYPVPGDYDGDGWCDIGVFRLTYGLWAIKGITRAYFGNASDYPVPGDYDGDGVKEIAIFRGASGLWALRQISRIYFGSDLDLAVPGDYDGSGTWGPAIFRPVSGLWAIRGLTRCYYGGAQDQPVPADYEGNYMDNIGVFRNSVGIWAIKGFTRVYYGTSGDIPVTR
jgi:hypothetical protein